MELLAQAFITMSIEDSVIQVRQSGGEIQWNQVVGQLCEGLHTTNKLTVLMRHTYSLYRGLHKCYRIYLGHVAGILMEKPSFKEN